MNEFNPYSPPHAEEEISQDGGLVEAAQASSGSRLGAHLIDMMISVAVFWVIAYSTGYIQRMHQASEEGIGLLPERLMMQLVMTIIFLGINWRLLAQGQTVGKRLLKIRIVRKNGEPIERLRIITHRFLPVWLMYYIPFVGSFVMLVDSVLIFRSGRNTLHDDIADTKVIAG